MTTKEAINNRIDEIIAEFNLVPDFTDPDYDIFNTDPDYNLSRLKNMYLSFFHDLKSAYNEYESINLFTPENNRIDMEERILEGGLDGDKVEVYRRLNAPMSPVRNGLILLGVNRSCFEIKYGLN